jgi:hypothetical protein
MATVRPRRRDPDRLHRLHPASSFLTPPESGSAWSVDSPRTARAARAEAPLRTCGGTVGAAGACAGLVVGGIGRRLQSDSRYCAAVRD